MVVPMYTRIVLDSQARITTALNSNVTEPKIVSWAESASIFRRYFEPDRRQFLFMRKQLKKCLPHGKFPLVSLKRSMAMAAVASSNNRSTERRLRFALVRDRFKGWRVRPADIEGRPDFVFPKSKLVVFVDGCFWHGCPKCGHYPRKNRAFWKAKILSNRRRDRKVVQLLTNDGFNVIRFWEHELNHNLQDCLTTIRSQLRE